MNLEKLVHEDIIISGLNPRKSIDTKSHEFKELKADIEKNGLLSPVSVNLKEGKYFLICGERRLTACAELIHEGKEMLIPAHVYSDLDNDAIMEMMISENIHRKDLDPFEEAQYYKMQLQLADNWDEASAKINKPVSYIQKRLSLLNLIKPFRKMYDKGQLSVDTCMFLARYSEAIQKEAFESLDHDEPGVSFGTGNFTHVISHNLYKLSEAPFDTTKVFGKHGACSSCPYNTESAPLLFDIKKKDKGQCMKSECYNEKLQIFYLEELKKACDDESIVLIANSSYMPNSIRDIANEAQKIVKDSGKVVYEMYTDYRTNKDSKTMAFDVTGKTMTLIGIDLIKKKASVKAKMDKSVELSKDDKTEIKKQIKEKIKRTEELKGEKLFEFIKDNFSKENLPNIDKIEHRHLITMMLDIANTHNNAYGLLTKSDFEAFEKDTDLSVEDALNALKPIAWLFVKTMLRMTGTVASPAGLALLNVVNITASDKFREDMRLFEIGSAEIYNKKKDRLNERLKEVK